MDIELDFEKQQSIELQANVKSPGLAPSPKYERQNTIEDVDTALEELGGFCRHQQICYIIQTLGVSMGSYALYPMGYYELQP